MNLPASPSQTAPPTPEAPPRTSAEHIEITPGVCGGKPRIAGHRIRVQDVVVWHERMGLAPDEIVARHPGLTLADVYAALTYYHDHRDEISAHLREADQLYAQLQAQGPSLLDKVRQRHGTDDSLPPG